MGSRGPCDPSGAAPILFGLVSVPEKDNDTYRKELPDLIRAKAKRQRLPNRHRTYEGDVVDLMAELRESKKQRKASSKRKAS